MSDPIAIASIILAVASTLGGLFGYWHLKLKSDCCKCCQMECTEKQQQKRPTISPPMSPIINKVSLEPPPKKETIISNIVDTLNLVEDISSSKAWDFEPEPESGNV